MEKKISVWQQELSQAFTDVEALCRHLKLDVKTLPLLKDFKDFPLRVPRCFVDLIHPGDPHDPLLLQILPLQQELDYFPGYLADPVGDLPAVATPGLIHKYRGRALFIATGSCAVHCRYCFRRSFPYAEQQLSSQKLQAALDYLRQHTEIKEVVLSGGDPLSLSDRKLGDLLHQLAGIAHIQRIRIHSRLPVVLPARISNTLIGQLQACDRQIVLVIHANHPNELSPAVAAACDKLRLANIRLLNQSVLLKGVNDDGAVLCRLSEQLFSIGVLPYYLHLLDKVAGAEHFAVPTPHAAQLMEYMRRELSGYLVPKLVQEKAGAAYKIPVL